MAWGRSFVMLLYLIAVLDHVVSSPIVDLKVNTVLPTLSYRLQLVPIQHKNYKPPLQMNVFTNNHINSTLNPANCEMVYYISVHISKTVKSMMLVVTTTSNQQKKYSAVSGAPYCVEYGSKVVLHVTRDTEDKVTLPAFKHKWYTILLDATTHVITTRLFSEMIPQLECTWKSVDPSKSAIALPAKLVARPNPLRPGGLLDSSFWIGVGQTKGEYPSWDSPTKPTYSPTCTMSIFVPTGKMIDEQRPTIAKREQFNNAEEPLCEASSLQPLEPTELLSIHIDKLEGPLIKWRGFVDMLVIDGEGCTVDNPRYHLEDTPVFAFQTFDTLLVVGSLNNPGAALPTDQQCELAEYSTIAFNRNPKLLTSYEQPIIGKQQEIIAGNYPGSIKETGTITFCCKANPPSDNSFCHNNIPPEPQEASLTGALTRVALPGKITTFNLTISKARPIITDPEGKSTQKIRTQSLFMQNAVSSDVQTAPTGHTPSISMAPTVPARPPTAPPSTPLPTVPPSSPPLTPPTTPPTSVPQAPALPSPTPSPNVAPSMPPPRPPPPPPVILPGIFPAQKLIFKLSAWFDGQAGYHPTGSSAYICRHMAMVSIANPKDYQLSYRGKKLDLNMLFCPNAMQNHREILPQDSFMPDFSLTLTGLGGKSKLGTRTCHISCSGPYMPIAFITEVWIDIVNETCQCNWAYNDKECQHEVGVGDVTLFIPGGNNQLDILVDKSKSDAKFVNGSMFVSATVEPDIEKWSQLNITSRNISTAIVNVAEALLTYTPCGPHGGEFKNEGNVTLSITGTLADLNLDYTGFISDSNIPTTPHNYTMQYDDTDIYMNPSIQDIVFHGVFVGDTIPTTVNITVAPGKCFPFAEALYANLTCVYAPLIPKNATHNGTSQAGGKHKGTSTITCSKHDVKTVFKHIAMDLMAGVKPNGDNCDLVLSATAFIATATIDKQYKRQFDVVALAGVQTEWTLQVKLDKKGFCCAFAVVAGGGGGLLGLVVISAIIFMGVRMRKKAETQHLLSTEV